MLVCSCGGCGRVWPAPARRVMARRVRAWVDLLVAVVIAVVVAGLSVRATRDGQEVLGRYGLSMQALVVGPPQLPLERRLGSLYEDLTTGQAVDATLIFLPILGSVVVGIHCLLHAGRSSFLRSLLSLWALAIVLGVVWELKKRQVDAPYLKRDSILHIFDARLGISLLAVSTTYLLVLPGLLLGRYRRAAFAQKDLRKLRRRLKAGREGKRA